MSKVNNIINKISNTFHHNFISDKNIFLLELKISNSAGKYTDVSLLDVNIV